MRLNNRDSYNYSPMFLAISTFYLLILVNKLGYNKFAKWTGGNFGYCLFICKKNRPRNLALSLLFNSFIYTRVI